MILNWKLCSSLALALVISPVFGAEKGDKTGSTYLALGDSIPFGFDPTKFNNLPTLPKPGEFVGYPELLSLGPIQARLVNAACPGETSGSFIVVGAPDNGCNGSGPDGQPPFKTSVGLKVEYSGSSQLAFAMLELQRNKNIKLVTLSLGGNDLSLLQKDCSTAPDFAVCVGTNIPTVLANYGANLAFILSQLRLQANYDKELVLMTNYVPNTDPLYNLAVTSLNGAMKLVGAQFGVKIADGFTAFRIASMRFGGDPCAAGLLVRLPQPGPNGACDIHPSLAGQAVLAGAVVWAQ